MNPLLLAVLSSVASKGINMVGDKLFGDDKKEEKKDPTMPIEMGEAPKVPQVGAAPDAGASMYAAQGQMTPAMLAMLQQYGSGSRGGA